MALDIRLDFITNIDSDVIDEMAVLRKKIIAIDEQLKSISDDLNLQQKTAGLRTIALARTHLETSLQFAIKSLCILGEINNDKNPD